MRDDESSLLFTMGSLVCRATATSFARDNIGNVIVVDDYRIDRHEPRSMVLYDRWLGNSFAVFNDIARI